MADVLGHPLIVGEDLLALTNDDAFLRWHPGTRGNFTTLAHPLHGTRQPELTPVASFGGYPLLQTGRGMFFADDHMNPFISIFSGMTEPVWHRDVANRVGIAASAAGRVFVNVGGPDALSAVVALNSDDGSVAWEHAPSGYPQEPLVMLQTSTQAQPDPAEANAMKAIAAKMGSRARAASFLDQPLTLYQSTPMINAPHGHWFNPGVVATENQIVAQVGQSIMALNPRDGNVLWTYNLPTTDAIHSLVASKDYVFFTTANGLFALNLLDGTKAMADTSVHGGELAIAKERLIVTTSWASKDALGGQIIVFCTDPDKKEEKDAPKKLGDGPPPPKRP